MEIKICKDCHSFLPIDQFSPKSCYRGTIYRSSICKSCSNARAKKWRVSNPERQKEIGRRSRQHNRENCIKCSKRWYENNRDRWFNAYLLRTYGISFNEFQSMVERQGGKCAICGNKPIGKLDVDHDHKTGAVRELLCKSCNTTVGHIERSPFITLLACHYIKKHKNA